MPNIIDYSDSWKFPWKLKKNIGKKIRKKKEEMCLSKKTNIYKFRFLDDP